MAVIVGQGFQVPQSALRDVEKCKEEGHPSEGDEDFCPGIHEPGRFTRDFDARSVRVMQDSDRRIEPITRQPIVRRRCRASGAGTNRSPAREMFQGIAGDGAGEAFIYRNGEADFVLDIVVWVMLSRGAAIDELLVGGKDFALCAEPTLASVKFGKDLHTNGKAEDYTD